MKYHESFDNSNFKPSNCCTKPIIQGEWPTSLMSYVRQSHNEKTLLTRWLHCPKGQAVSLPRTSVDRQYDKLACLLLNDPQTHGYCTNLWILTRVADVICKCFVAIRLFKGLVPPAMDELKLLEIRVMKLTEVTTLTGRKGSKKKKGTVTT